MSETRISRPRISVVTPSFNQGRYLEQTIQSVLGQNYPSLEYIVIDGGSTDGSIEIIRKYAKHLAYWVSEPDRGQSHAINKGFARATGELLAWLNSDDYYMPGALARVAESTEAQPDGDVFVGAGRLVDDAGVIIDYRHPPSEVSVQSLYRWASGEWFQQPSCMFRHLAWETAGPLDETVHIAFDLDLWFKMARAGCRFVAIQDLLTTALVHSQAKTTAYPELTRVDVAVVSMRYGGEQAARRYLENLARRVAWCEPNLFKILDHPVVKTLTPVLERIVKPAARHRDLVPRWVVRRPDRGGPSP